MLASDQKIALCEAPNLLKVGGFKDNIISSPIRTESRLIITVHLEHRCLIWLFFGNFDPVQATVASVLGNP